MYCLLSAFAWLFSRLNPTTSVDSCACRTAGATTRPLAFVLDNGDVLGDCREVLHIGAGRSGDDIAVTRGGDRRGQRRIGLPDPNIESCHEIYVPARIRLRCAISLCLPLFGRLCKAGSTVAVASALQPSAIASDS